MLFRSPDTLKRIDFRSLYAWGKDTAIVFTAGSPAICYKTTNGGKSWDKTFYLEHKDVFVNSMDFKNNKEGIVWGEPMDGKFFMLKTNDGGDTWDKLDAPIALPGDGGFAASNSCVAYLPSGKITFVMGVTRSCFYWSDSDSNIDWNVSNTGLVQGGESNADGIYCVKMFDDNNGIVAGGNYANVNENSQVLAVTNDGGKTWTHPVTLPHGFISAIGVLNAKNGEIIAVGSHGSSISKDNGLNWLKNGDDGYHALSESPSGNYIYFCGERGKLGIIIL